MKKLSVFRISVEPMILTAQPSVPKIKSSRNFANMRNTTAIVRPIKKTAEPNKEALKASVIVILGIVEFKAEIILDTFRAKQEYGWKFEI